MKAPPLPFIPAEHVGKLVALIALCYAGDLDEGQRALEPLRSLATPLADLTSPMPYPGMFELTREAAGPQPHSIRSGFMSAFDDEYDRSDPGARPAHAGPDAAWSSCAALGGAMARVPADATAFSQRDKPLLRLGHRRLPRTAGHADDPVRLDGGPVEELRPKAEGVYVNFLDDEGDRRIREAYSSWPTARLAEVKRATTPRTCSA